MESVKNPNKNIDKNTENNTSQNITIGILAHVDAGKTTLSEALLYKTGRIRSLGRVDHQDAYLDNDAQERERGITIFSKQARLTLESRSCNKKWSAVLLDTPGHVDFSAEMERALLVLDYAVLVISASDGVQGHTRTLWRLLRHYNVPTFIFVNKMDMDGMDASKMQEELKRELSDACVAFAQNLSAEDTSAIAPKASAEDTVAFAQNSSAKDTTAFAQNISSKDITSTDEKNVALSQSVYEELAMCSENLLSEYMENDEISQESISRAIANREVFPCFYGSALKLLGVDELIEGLCAYMEQPKSEADFAAKVYKIARDDRGNRLTFMKILGGCLNVRDKIEYKDRSDNTDITEKVDQLRLYSGEKFETTDTADVGELVAVTGLSATYPGQNIGLGNVAGEPILEPVLSYKLILPEGVNPAVFFEKIKQLEEEDPQLYIVWNEEFKEIRIQLMGQVQMEVLVRLIKDRFGVVVTFGPGSIVYKETIAKTVEGVGHFEPLRHYAEVHLLLSPADRGSGITVASVCSEDILAKNWQRLIATHIEEREHKGVLTGSALTDVKITILTGRAHVKHTEGGDFRQATYRAIRQGLKSTESVLLEPYYSFTLEVPTEQVGRAMTDLEQRFAKTNTPQFVSNGGHESTVITGQAPVSTMQDYVSLVHGYTKGLGHLSLELCGYDECHNPQEVIEQIHYDSEEDFRNPTGSVFCAHGAGFIVPWNEVETHMHLPFVYEGDASDDALTANIAQAFSADIAESIAGNKRRVSWEKQVSNMSSIELDAELSDVYKREFGMSKNDMEEQERKKWAGKKKNEYDGLSGKPRTVKHDKHGHPIYPKKEKSEQYLIVDGYNIIFAWEDLKNLSKINIDSARDALKDIMSDYQGYTGVKLILVFDAYKVRGNAGKKETYHNIDVVYTKQDETADAFIEKTVFEIRDKYKVTVATSDGLEQQTVLSLGALRMSARELRDEIARVKQNAFK